MITMVLLTTMVIVKVMVKVIRMMVKVIRMTVKVMVTTLVLGKTLVDVWVHSWVTWQSKIR